MLYLLFRLGIDRYALDTTSVEEVLPVVNWKEIPQVAPGVLGVFSYHGQIVPLVDLSEFIVGRAARLHMSTRVILIRYRDAEKSTSESDGRLLGLMAEEATFTFRAEPEQFVEPGVEVEAARYLGPVMQDAHGIVQLVDAQRLLPAQVRQQLYLHVDSSEAESG